MRSRPFTVAIMLAAFVGGFALSQPGEARVRDMAGVSPPDGSSPDSLLDRRSRKGPADAAKEAQKRYGGGKVLNVESTGDGYHVKLLLDGDVRVVFVPSH